MQVGIKSKKGINTMRLKALSNYNNDTDTRFGDCILVYDDEGMIIYDCGHIWHAEEVARILKQNSTIKQIHIVISHNDSDHVLGIKDIMKYLYNNKYKVIVYTALYLKYTKEVLKVLNDGRRTPKATRERILKNFNGIRGIVEQAEEYGFTIKDAAKDTTVYKGTIVGPKEEEFSSVVAAVVESENSGKKIDGETVMNAASIQMKVKLKNAATVLLCGDATPEYLHNLDKYNIIQLPHHGKLESAQKIFESLGDCYSKTYLVSDNTGSGETSGGSDKLIEYMKQERFDSAKNTRNGVVNIPDDVVINGGLRQSRRVKLGEMVSKY